MTFGCLSHARGRRFETRRAHRRSRRTSSAQHPAGWGEGVNHENGCRREATGGIAKGGKDPFGPITNGRRAQTVPLKPSPSPSTSFAVRFSQLVLAKRGLTEVSPGGEPGLLSDPYAPRRPLRSEPTPISEEVGPKYLAPDRPTPSRASRRSV